MESFNEQKTQRIQELEGLVDQYRAEVQNLNEQLSKKEDGSLPVTAPPSNKRPRDEESDERLGVLSRKNRALQDGLNAPFLSVSQRVNTIS